MPQSSSLNVIKVFQFAEFTFIVEYPKALVFRSDPFTPRKKIDYNLKKKFVVFLKNYGRNILCYLHSNRLSLFRRFY